MDTIIVDQGQTMYGFFEPQVYCVGNWLEQLENMKLSCLFALLLVVGATVMFLNILSPTRASGAYVLLLLDFVTLYFNKANLQTLFVFIWSCCACISDLIETNSGDKATRIAAVSRKLKENGNRNNIGDMGEVSLTDYDVDPVPTSSKFLEPGPIQHGSPLNPYIPKPPPPGDYD
ncbi:uncharacterized protein LOC124831273 [Vigna umbellata]|uniref:uncharacterized protein LOC124831273 n=1 Tax=Vigna umbellata TaxID=87088 RepID=UPI001F5E6967|nr:uncharacterized protein LOC124831273 [Vigna umbellata]